ncbi:MAG: hypothetical protein GYB53_23370 [Rhodobacteraceae bacterium]|nr:hypothetical protein [Paracoccaceae bacterium]MBR9823990.1 hypothetical protein [Paracoccaceae bacterium]
MAYVIDSFISPLGMILIELLDGEKKPVLTLTTEVMTGHVAVYYGDQIWRVEANPTGRSARQRRRCATWHSRPKSPRSCARSGSP